MGLDHPDFGGCRSRLNKHTATRPPETHKSGAKWVFSVTIVESWEERDPARVPHEIEYRPSAGGGLLGSFCFVFN